MVNKERNRRPPKDKVAPVAYPAAKEEGSKCKKHSPQPTSGVCPACLRERLGALHCPSCNNNRPCGRCDVAATSPAVSKSSEPEPGPIRRTRSAAVPPVYRPAKTGGGRRMRTEAEDAARVMRSRSLGGVGSSRRQDNHSRVRGDMAAGLKSCRRYLRVLMKAFRPRKASNVMQSWG